MPLGAAALWGLLVKTRMIAIDLLRPSGALSAAKPARPPIGRGRGLILALGLAAILWGLISWIIVGTLG